MENEVPVLNFIVSLNPKQQAKELDIALNRMNDYIARGQK
jgi:hypothetical protein